MTIKIQCLFILMPPLIPGSFLKLHGSTTQAFTRRFLIKQLKKQPARSSNRFLSSGTHLKTAQFLSAETLILNAHSCSCAIALAAIIQTSELRLKNLQAL